MLTITAKNRKREFAIKNNIKNTDKSTIILVAFAIWTAMELLNRTWFAGPLNMSVSRDVIRCVCLIVLVFYEVRFGRRDRPSLIGLLIAIGLAALALHVNHKIFFDSICFVYVARDIPLRRLARVSFITISLLGILVVISSFIGIIPNAIYENPGRADRYALGFGHPNTAPTFFTYAFINWAYLRGRRFGIIDADVILGLGIVLYHFTDSRTALILTITLIIAMLVFRFFPYLHVNSVGLKLLMSGIVVVIGIVSFSLSLAYNPDVGWMATLNKIMSGRLYYSQKAIEECGMTFFGQKVSLGSPSNYDLITGQWIERTNELILDNVYVRIPIQCGIVFSAVIFLLTTVANWRLVLTKQYRLIALIAIAALYGIMEPTASYLFYNCLLFLLAIPLIKVEDVHDKACVDPVCDKKESKPYRCLKAQHLL